MSESGRRTYDPSRLEVEPSTAGATSADDLREDAFDAWWDGVGEWIINNDSIPNISHEAFCAGWEAANVISAH